VPKIISECYELVMVKLFNINCSGPVFLEAIHQIQLGATFATVHLI